MSSTYSTITASVVQISSSGALGSMLSNLSSRTVDPFSSAYFSTKAYAHGVSRDAHEETIHQSRKNVIRNKFEISREFDLVSQLVVVIDVPTLTAGSYVANLGPALIESATLSMGGHALATLTGGLIHCLEELGGNPGKAATELYDVAETAPNSGDRRAGSRLYVPMAFWFTKSLSKALNLVGSSFQRAYLDLTMKSLASCIENDSNGAGAAYGTDVPIHPMLGSMDTTGANSGTGTGRVTVDTHGITLNEADREAFSVVDQMTLMTEAFTTTIDVSGDTNLDVTTFGKNLCYEIIVATQAIPQPGEEDGIAYDTSLNTLSMSISGQSRLPEGIESQLYNKVMPFLHRSQVPQDVGIHSIPISFFPEDESVPDSHVNLSKLDSLTLRLNGNARATVFLLCYNILVEARGMKARFFV